MKKRIIAAALFAVLGLTACGEAGKSEKSSENTVETTAATEAATTEASEETEATTEIETTSEVQSGYEPTEEIIKADLSSGYIQIGKTVFRAGGYVTVGEFYDKYKDEFDLSELNPDEYLAGSSEKSLQITALYDPDIKVRITYGKKDAEDNERTKVSDGVVENIDLYTTDTTVLFSPKGLSNPCDMNYEELKEFIGTLGLREDDSYGVSYNDSYKESSNNFALFVKAKETNLYGKTPTYFYVANFNSNTLEGISFDYNGWVYSGNLSDFDEDDISEEDYEEEE